VAYWNVRDNRDHGGHRVRAKPRQRVSNSEDE
jgi:hypothetical protein